MLTEEEKDLRLKLYNQGLNDKEMSAAIYITIPSIIRWRRERGLPPNREVRKQYYTNAVPYGEALESRQCPEMHKFLVCLIVLAKRQRGRVDTGSFIKEWRKQGGGVKINGKG